MSEAPDDLVPPEGDDLRNWVVPIGAVTDAPGGVDFEFRGTGTFLAGDDGYCLTAGHVLDSLCPPSGAALVRNGEWRFAQIREAWRHNTEDLGLLRFDPGARGSPFEVSPLGIHQSSRFRQWGYPQTVQFDHVVDGRAIRSLELVYDEGYVRRRLTEPQLPKISSRSLFELSGRAGPGASGAPLLVVAPGVSPWQMIGVYVGERSCDAFHSGGVGYGVRLAGVDVNPEAPEWRSWSPSPSPE